MSGLFSILQDSEEDLLAAVRKRADGRDPHLAALEEVWNMSFQGVTSTLLKCASERLPGYGLDLDDPEGPVTQFGRLEARRHRVRGVSLEMFRALLKLFRLGYQEVLRERIADPGGQAQAAAQIERFFDQLEISLCIAWVREAEDGGLRELQAKNLELVTERDRYVAVFESSPLPTLLLAHDLSIRNMNHAAYGLFVGSGAPGAYYYRAEARPAAGVLADLFPDFFQEIRSAIAGPEERTVLEWTASRDGAPRHFRVVIARILDQAQAFADILVTLDDQTERVNAAKERERMLAEITAALAEVKNLSSLLPICAWCKKIRDDQGYWDQLEDYLSTHAGLVFSHGICPDCASKMRAEGR